MAVVSRTRRPQSRSRPRHLTSKTKLSQAPLGNLGSTVAGQREPRGTREAKPVKTPRMRVNTAKQGTPQHLTVSQRRKLVRLWTSTSLTLEEQGDLIAPSGTSALKIRSLRLHLRRILGENYPQWRPRDSHVRKRRAKQLQEYYNMKKNGVLSPQEEVLPRTGSVITPNAYENSIGGHAVVSFTEHQAGYPTTPFDSVLYNGNGSDRRRELPLDSGLNNTSAIAWPELLPPEATTWLLNSDGFSEDTNFGIASYGSHKEIFADVPSPSILETVDPRDLLVPRTYAPEFMHQSAMVVNDEHASGAPCAQLPESTGARMKEGSYLPSDLVPYSEDQGQELASRSYSPNDQYPTSSRGNGLRISRLSERLNRLSKHSLEERQAIKLIMRLSSASMLSPFKESISACLHGSRESLKSVFSIPIEASRSKSIRNPGQWRLDMPGDFLTSQVNTFPHHIHCDLPAAQRQDLTVCDFCLYNPPSRHLQNTYGIPLAVIYFKRGEQVDEKVIAEAKDWSDRFGNSRLHIAAALGVKYSTLKHIIDKGANVNALNTARQSFMYVIDPYHWSLEDMVFLREHLKKQEFKFHHRDLQGLTFVDHLKEREMDPLCFAQCWLEVFKERDSFTGRIINYSQLKKLFTENGGTQEQWLSLVWTLDDDGNDAEHYRPTQHDVKLRMLFEEMVHDPVRFLSRIGHVNVGPEPNLSNVYTSFMMNTYGQPEILDLRTQFSNYRNERNQNNLHLAVTATSEDDSGMKNRRKIRLGRELVKALIDLHVDVNHHDDFGETVVMTLIQSPLFRVDVLEYLLSHGANPDARNHEGDSALHLSVTLGNVEATNTLISHGANIHARNMRGLGVVAAGRAAKEAVGYDPTFQGRISMCISVLLCSGAVESPNLYDEWDLKSPPTPSSKRPKKAPHFKLPSF